MPPAKALPPPTEGELVSIANLEGWAQLAFKGYKTLNRIQSRIFNTAYKSNENILVCAPTGVREPKSLRCYSSPPPFPPPPPFATDPDGAPPTLTFC